MTGFTWKNSPAHLGPTTAVVLLLGGSFGMPSISAAAYPPSNVPSTATTSQNAPARQNPSAPAIPAPLAQWRARMELATEAVARKDWAQAESLLNASLEQARAFGNTPTPVAPLFYLATVAQATGRPAYARGLYQDARTTIERFPDLLRTPLYGSILNDYGTSYALDHRWSDAEPLLKKALEVREGVLGPTHADVRQTLVNLVLVDRETKDWKDVEAYGRRALPLVERDSGKDSPATRDLVRTLALACLNQRDVQGWEPLMSRYLSMSEAAHVPRLSEQVAPFVSLLRSLGREREAQDLEHRVATTRSGVSK